MGPDTVEQRSFATFTANTVPELLRKVATWVEQNERIDVDHLFVEWQMVEHGDAEVVGFLTYQSMG